MKRISTGKDGAFEVLVGQAAIWKVGRGIVMLAANKLLERREARFLSCHVTKDRLATCCIPLAWCKVPLGAGTWTWPSECWHETLVSSDVLFIGPFGGAKVLGVLQGSLRALQNQEEENWVRPLTELNTVQWQWTGHIANFRSAISECVRHWWYNFQVPWVRHVVSKQACNEQLGWLVCCKCTNLCMPATWRMVFYWMWPVAGEFLHPFHPASTFCTTAWIMAMAHDQSRISSWVGGPAAFASGTARRYKSWCTSICHPQYATHNYQHTKQQSSDWLNHTFVL